MLKSRDIEEIQCDLSHFVEGLDYALISWTSTFNRMGKPNPYLRLQKIIIGIIAEKAVEKYLSSNNVSYETAGKTKWYQTDRYDIGINNFAVDIKSSFIDLDALYFVKEYIPNQNNCGDWFLKCTALVPLDQFNPGKNERRAHKRDKIYLFPFVEGYFNTTLSNNFLVHTFWDYRWLKRAEHKNSANVGNLKISYSGTLNNSTLKVYGTTKKNEICIEEISLDKSNIISKNNFFQVFSILWIGSAPDGNLTIRSLGEHLKETIKPEKSFILEKTDNGYWPLENNWQSLEIHACKVHLAGWIYEEDFRVIGKEFKRFSKNILQYSETKVDNWGCAIKELNPMSSISKA